MIAGGMIMNWDRQTLKKMAKTALEGSYWKSVLVALLWTVSAYLVAGGSAAGSGNSGIRVLFHNGGDSFTGALALILGIILLAGIASFAALILLKIFLILPLEVGCQRYFTEDVYAPTMLDRLKAGFTPNYWNVVKTQLLRLIFNSLWYLLLVVPGIVKSYEYRMIPFILAENPNMPSDEVFALSKKMMDGEKWQAFVMDLSFIGWWLLSVLTFGIVGTFYLNPYYALTQASLYHALKQKTYIWGRF